VCLAGVDRVGTNGTETLNWVNQGTGTVSGYLLVDSYGSGQGGKYNLGISYATPAAGDVCSTAQAVPSATTLTAETTNGFTNDMTPATGTSALCTGYGAPGPDKVYAITLNSAQMLTVTATPVAGNDLSLYLVGGPPTNCSPLVPQCLAGRDQGGNGGTETVTYTNNTGAMQTVYVVIDSYYAVPITYDVTFVF
jgi:hypothetical protein